MGQTVTSGERIGHRKMILSKDQEIYVKMFIGILLSVALCGVHGQEAAEGLGELSRILQAYPGSNDDAKTEIDQLKNEVSRLKTRAAADPGAKAHRRRMDDTLAE